MVPPSADDDQVEGSSGRNRGTRGVVSHVLSVWVLLAVLQWLVVHLGVVPPAPLLSWTVLLPFVVTLVGGLCTVPVVLSAITRKGSRDHPVLSLVVAATFALLQTVATGYPFLFPRLLVATGVDTLHRDPGPRVVRAYAAVVVGGVSTSLLLAHSGLVPHVLPLAVDIALSFGVATTAGYVTLTVARSAALVEAGRRQLLEAEQRRVRDLHHAATHDPLTGVLNRLGLEAELQALLAAAGRGRGVGVVYLDLDDFKPVNDRFGHRAGDTVLFDVSRRLTAAARPGDLVARVGGDEFVVVVAGCPDAERLDTASLRLQLALREPVRLGEDTVVIGASAGFTWTDDPAADADELIAVADAEMFLAKSARSAHDAPDGPRDTQSTSSTSSVRAGEDATGLP